MGSGFFVNLSKDMRTILPGVQGLSSSNLRYMKKFYELYSDPILPQFVEELKSKEDSINVPQLVGDLSDKELFSIPWGHHRAIIDKCKLDREKSILFVKKTILNNWSRAVLLNFLDTDLYERQGKAISNFEYALSEPQSDLAQEITKDPYNFDFVAIREDYSEKELKDALMDNITKFRSVIFSQALSSYIFANKRSISFCLFSAFFNVLAFFFFSRIRSALPTFCILFNTFSSSCCTALAQYCNRSNTA